MPTKYQRSLYPVQITQTYTNDSGSCDMTMIGVGADNIDYAIKLTTDGNGRVPASEMFCYELAQCFDIATPGYTIVRLRDGSLAFGSVYESVQQIKDISKRTDILSGKIKVRNLKAFLSKVYAFDLFVNNIDRHFGNYLFRETTRATIALAFDFSRAWYEIDAYGYQATKHLTKTKLAHAIIGHYKQYDKKVAGQTLDDILTLPKDMVEAIFKVIPDSWFYDNFASEFLNWWGSDDMTIRIANLKKEI